MDKSNAKANAKRAEFIQGKLQCLICKGWYWKLGGHTWNFHKVTAYEYQNTFGLEHKGMITENAREHLRKLAYKNKELVIDKNLLQKGKSTRYTKGINNNYERKAITLQRVASLGKRTWKINNKKLCN